MKRMITLIFSGIYALSCSAQTESSSSSPASDSVINKSTLTIGLSYSSNANYYGQRAAENIPYAAAAATYRLKSGVYFTGLAYRLLNDSGSLVSAGSAGAGIGFALSDKFSADLSYSHTFYPANSPFLQASNPDNASASLTYDNWLSSTMNVDVALGKTTDIFVTAGTGKQLNLGSISAQDIVTLTPSINMVAGTQHFYQTFVTKKRSRDSLLGILPLPGRPASGSTTKTTSTTSFNPLSYNFKCPLAYNRAHYVVELDYQLSLLSQQAQAGAGQLNSYFTASFYYQF